VLFIHFAIFAIIISWRDFQEHLISKRINHLALLSLIPLLHESLLEASLLSLINFMFYTTINLLSGRAIGRGDIRLSPLMGAYISAFSGDISDLIWSNAISWLACSFTLIIHLLKRESLKGKRVAFAPYLFFGVFLFAMNG
jgi:prepilin signal peptidase PulO-like enzyme (type II secretory pathway)